MTNRSARLAVAVWAFVMCPWLIVLGALVALGLVEGAARWGLRKKTSWHTARNATLGPMLEDFETAWRKSER